MGDGNRGNLSYADERVNAKFAAPPRATRESKRPDKASGLRSMSLVAGARFDLTFGQTGACAGPENASPTFR